MSHEIDFEMPEADRDTQRLRYELNEANLARNSLENDCAELRAQLAAKDARIAELTKRVDNFEKYCAPCRERISALEARIAELEALATKRLYGKIANGDAMNAAEGKVEALEARLAEGKRWIQCAIDNLPYKDPLRCLLAAYLAEGTKEKP